MKNLVNELYNCPMSQKLKGHLLNDMGLSAEDKKIVSSLMEYSGDSNFHYDNTGIPKERFERRLRNINFTLISELIRLSNEYIRKGNDP